MKKFAAGLIAATTLFMSVSAFAAESATPDSWDAYQESDNSANFTLGSGESYTTVKITDNNSNIVYIDEDQNAYSGSVNFMLKDGSSDGEYTALFGGGGATKTIKFNVGKFNISGSSDTASLDTANRMTVADEATEQEKIAGQAEGATLYKKGFTFLATGKSYSKIYVVSGDGKTCYGSFDLNMSAENITGEAEVAYGIQIYNLSEKEKDINLYLASDTVNGGAEQ